MSEQTPLPAAEMHAGSVAARALQESAFALPSGPSNPYALAWRRVWRMRVGRFSLIILGVMIFVAVAAPVFAPHSPSEQFRGDELRAPGSDYLLGTDQLGRDLLSRLIYA